MKKLSKIALKNQGSVLNESEMQKILGGGSYVCQCGEDVYLVSGDTLSEAYSALCRDYNCCNGSYPCHW